ncbi:MAG: amidohydrolase family protein [Acidobacteria bacterium]|nr:amidohydrolase family protein [Acidobacteriota bacterium]MCA1638098.1 amidohydrolase family protein [Acidobacteriota bacterium]
MLKRNHTVVLLIAVLANCTFAQNVSQKSITANNNVLAFVNVNVVPMDSERVVQNQTIIIRDGRIAAIGAAKRVRVPQGAVKIDGRGRYLMPGLADMHVHLEYFDREAQLLLFLANGVTTVRNMDGRPNILEWRKRIAAGNLLGPNIFTAGAILEGKPPFRNDNRVVETPAEAVAEVVKQKQEGYDFIKVYHTLDRETYKAIVAEATKHGLTVAGHVPRSVGLPGALAANQKSIEHLDGFIDEIEADDSPLKNQRSWLKRYFAVKVDDAKIRSIVGATERAKVWNVPTLVERRLSALTTNELQTRLRQPELKYLPPETAEFWSASNKRITGRMSADDFARLAEGEKTRNRLVKLLHDGGARLLVGTDTPNAFVIPGFLVVEELQNFVEAGLTPYQAIKAATKDAAEFLGASNEFGTISVGRRADLILVEGNPLESVANLKRRAGVMVRGRWLTTSDLQKQLDALAVSYNKD